MPPTCQAASSRLLLALVVVWLAGCVVVPQTRESYDEGCRMMKREVVLETTSAERFKKCEGAECTAMMVATGVVTAASAVVSGSIAMVGNVLYWFERQGRCKSGDGAATPPAPVATSATSAKPAKPATPATPAKPAAIASAPA